VSTWAIATPPQPRRIWPGRALIWEASEPYLYLRATADGRVICGGEDEPFTDEARRDALIPAKAETIAAKLAALLPGVDPTAAFAWAGAFGTTPTGLPILRRLPRRPRIHSVLGYGGNGITFSRIAAEMIATELAGGKDRDSDVFAG
jgi:glycine/D-amino acid oxidase-like deaminating enzyme